MFIRQCHRYKNGKRHAYWALVESYRTKRGPRQRIISYLGQMDQAGRLGLEHLAEGKAGHQHRLFDDVRPEWVQVDVNRISVENCSDFGGPWLALQLIGKLGMDEFFQQVIAPGREHVPWHIMAWVLVICRFCDPSSELHIAEHSYGHSALKDLLGIAVEKVTDDRLYRTLDKLLPHKEELEIFLKHRLGELFDLEYDLLLYDITSTYFEGQACGNALAERGYSRDKRGDRKQVCIGLIVSKCGMPLGYEVFAGNRRDVTTVQAIVETIESRYGKADRIWAMDRGMVSQEVMAFMLEGERKYIMGTSKGMLKKYRQELLKDNWQEVHKGLEVKLCPSPDGQETFILCRSEDRVEKEAAIHQRFEQRIEEGLKRIEESCRKRKYKLVTIAKRVGRLMGQNTRSAGLFETDVIVDAHGGAKLVWKKVESWRDWAQLSEGCYLLRSNITDWQPEDLWKAYMQLTEAEAAFRIHKSDLRIRPIWHHKKDRVLAHILVCFLTYVLWKTLGQMCRQAGLGDEPRRVIEELAKIRAVDVVMPTKAGPEIRRRCISQPTEHQAILLQKLKLNLPSNLAIMKKKNDRL